MIIKKFHLRDEKQLLDLWLDTNLDVHDFVDKKYWRDNFEYVKKAFLKAEIYTAKEAREILGFIGLNGSYIEGLFVKKHSRSKGIGQKLLNKAKEINPVLSLNVYLKNEKAQKFYLREGFFIKNKNIDENTGEAQYFMIWEK